LHPGGKLGKRLTRVEALMHSGEAIPQVSPHTRMPQVIYEMSRKKLGITTVTEGERLVGVISDGDLRRLLEARGKDVLDLTAEDCMTRSPKTIARREFATTALAIMEQKKITSLVVVDGDMKLEGIVHLHDLWGTEMVQYRRGVVHFQRGLAEKEVGTRQGASLRWPIEEGRSDRRCRAERIA
jgi:arabinose-5-phosphate isomerase